MTTNQPFWISQLPKVLVLICLVHASVKYFVLIIDQYSEIEKNNTNTHFALSAVIIALIIILIIAVFIDSLIRSHSSFNWVLGLNITLIASCLFVIGFLFGYAGQILLASIGQYETCKQLGLHTKVEHPEKIDNVQYSDDKLKKWQEDNCSEALRVAFRQLCIDLVITIGALPFHIFVLVYSWTFSRTFRSKSDTFDAEKV